MKIKTFICHSSTPSKLLSQTTQPLTSIHTKLSPILNKTKIKTHKLTLHNDKEIFYLVIINNTTYNNKMTHSSYFTSLPAQPSIHFKKNVPTLYDSIFPYSKLQWVNIHTTYFAPTFTHCHYSLCCRLLHTRNHNDGFSCGLHKTKSTLWKYLCAWHGLAKNSKLCNDATKAQ